VSKVRILSFVALLLALPLAVAEDKKEVKKGDASKLLGDYTVVSGKRDGKDLPKSDFAKSTVHIEKGKIYGHDEKKKEFFGATYTLDTGSKPWKISMVSTSPKKGEKAEGVIEVDGDKVRLAYALPGGKTPTSFEAGEKQQSFVLMRVKEKREK
jgi:uncharacterized protein (TIGR03067 family)